MRTKDFLGLIAEKKGLVIQSMWFWDVGEEWHAHNNPSRVQKAVPDRNAEKESKGRKKDNE